MCKCLANVQMWECANVQIECFFLRNPNDDRNKQNNDMKKIFTLLTLALACVMQLSAQKLQITNGGEVVDCSTVGVITYTNAIQMGKKD